jgi:hypothetical protein
MCLKKFHLDIGNFVSLPQLSWEAFLLYKFSKESMNVPKIEFYDAFRKDLEGGLSQTWNISCRSNSPLLKDYRPDMPTINIFKVDMNSMHPSVMAMKLHVSDFEQIDVSSKTLREWIDFFKTI